MTKFNIEALHGQVHKPGIYFNMSNEEYHADKSLSNSGMGNILKTPKHYWYQSPFNPNKEPLDTLALKNGKVLHTLLLEAHKFHEEWKVKPGVQNTTVAGMVGEGAYNNLKKAVEAIRADKLIYGLFTYGFPEVSMFWVDLETGVPCRVRFDFLGAMLASDLKGVADLDNYKLGYSIADYGYYRQQALYLDGVEYVKQLIREGRAIVDGCPDEAWLGRFMESVHDKFAFVFQEKVEPYVTRAEQLCERTREVGQMNYRRALHTYKTCYEEYGEECWPSGYEGRVGLIQLDDLPAKINILA